MIIERSGPHLHLTEQTYLSLSRGVPIEIDRPLANENFFVAKMRVSVSFLHEGKLIALNSVPILGPYRKYNQLEIHRSLAPTIQCGVSGNSNLRVYTSAIRGDSAAIVEDVIVMCSPPHAHVPSAKKHERDCEIRIGSLTVNGPAYFDPRITVPCIHLDNDFYNAASQVHDLSAGGYIVCK